MIVLLLLGYLIFDIYWGDILPVTIITVGSIVAASAFGIFVMSLFKNTKQSGIILGSILVVTGLLGMIKIFTMGGISGSQWKENVSLFVPQGWAIRGLLQVMNGANITEILFTFGVLTAISVALLTIGIIRFQKRYA
jgi:hypothetical protein